MGKFIIHAEAVKNRFPITPQYIVKRSDDCIACGRCAARCIYDVHERSQADYRKMAEPDSTKCKRCHVCVQDCSARALSISRNPEFDAMGTELFTPENINVMIKEGETGKNPVSGGGYGGRFSGSGFDSFWTDMSEIVRPTRDGIHAREYISTTVEIGRKPRDVNFLKFDALGNPLTNIPPSIEINLPIIFDLSTLPLKSEQVALAALKTASELRTLAIIEREQVSPELDYYSSYLIESFDPEKLSWGELTRIAKDRTILELHYSPGISELPHSLKKLHPDLIIIVRISEPEDIERQVREVYQSGADVIHLRSRDSLVDKVRRAHLSLVGDTTRNEVTIIASGGVAEAAHVPKTIILGADAVALDIPILVAMECNLCRLCFSSGACPRHLGDVDPFWGMKRIRNLIASWHNQLLEVLGAMGMREVSRLRGEVGRAIFFDDIESEWLRDLEEAKHKV